MDNFNILYVSKLCARPVFDQLFFSARTKPAQQAQKYNRLMAEGLAAIDGVNVLAIGAPPVSRSISDKYWFPAQRHRQGSLTYQTVSVLNIPIVTQIMLLVHTFFTTLRAMKRGETCAVVCDALNITMSAAALLAAKIKSVQTVGIVTDVPGYYAKQTNVLVEKINYWMMCQFSSYLFLTRQMSEVIRPGARPFVVIEGQVDIQMMQSDHSPEEKFPEKVCMYTGSLAKEYGISMLTEAFLKAGVPGAALHIYGSGDFEQELIEICRVHANIHFGGTLPNAEIIALQKKAHVLVNPRPTNQEFTKYSFPSKNMEYMVSGTPLITTRLPGMPVEYLPYIYVFERETVDGYAATLSRVLQESAGELSRKGQEAKQFVLREKNNVTQAKKLWNMIGKGERRT